jgi:hypothetical protein
MRTCPLKWRASLGCRASMRLLSAISGKSAPLTATILQLPLRCLECSAPMTRTSYGWQRKESNTRGSHSRGRSARASAAGSANCEVFTRDSVQNRLETWCCSFQPERLRASPVSPVALPGALLAGFSHLVALSDHRSNTRRRQRFSQACQCLSDPAQCRAPSRPNKRSDGESQDGMARERCYSPARDHRTGHPPTGRSACRHTPLSKSHSRSWFERFNRSIQSRSSPWLSSQPH